MTNWFIWSIGCLVCSSMLLFIMKEKWQFSKKAVYCNHHLYILDLLNAQLDLHTELVKRVEKLEAFENRIFGEATTEK